MSAFEKWVSPAGSGDKSGESAANAHPMASDADKTWLLGVYAAWHTEMLTTATAKGLNQPRTHTTVKQGDETGYGPAFASYLEDVRQQVVYARVHWISDAGNYDLTSQAAGAIWLTTTTAHGGAAGSGGSTAPGTAGNPDRVIVNNAYRLSDGKRSDEVSGGSETRSATLPAKNLTAPGADTNAANYTSGWWTGPVTTVAKSWSAALPSPIQAQVRGSRTPDPRTAAQRATRAWNVDTSTTRRRYLPSPLATTVGADLLDDAGARVSLAGGDVYDFSTKTLIGNTPLSNAGGYFVKAGSSYVAWEGFNFTNFMSPFTFVNVSPGSFKSFRDITSTNTKYGVWRGDNQNDIEIRRWKSVTNVQKQFAPGTLNQRWFVCDQVFDGGYVVGDPIQNLISVASTYEAGPILLRRCIIERCWDAVDTAATYYPNGDGIELEALGVCVLDTWIDKTTDGGIDSKPGPYWENIPMRVFCNVYAARGRRLFRLWSTPFTSRRDMQTKTIMRECVGVDPRQYHIYLIGYPTALNEIDWTNPSGLANFAGAANTSYAVSNDGALGGDIAVTLRRPYDGRTGTQKKVEGANAVAAYTGAAPYKMGVYLPLADSPNPGMTVDGDPIDIGARLSVAAGNTRTFSLTGLPAGATIRWSEVGPGEGTVNPDGSYSVVFKTV